MKYEDAIPCVDVSHLGTWGWEGRDKMVNSGDSRNTWDRLQKATRLAMQQRLASKWQQIKMPKAWDTYDTWMNHKYYMCLLLTLWQDVIYTVLPMEQWNQVATTHPTCEKKV